MTVNRYLFQSPSSSPVQVGRLDPSVKQDDTSSTSDQLDTSSQKSQVVNPLQTDTSSSTIEVQPTVSADTLLDVYA